MPADINLETVPAWDISDSNHMLVMITATHLSQIRHMVLLWLELSVS